MIRIYSYIVLILFALLLPWSVAIGDEGEYQYPFWEKKSGLGPVTNALYKEECGSCHFAYQPGLLPERSWRKIMASLDHHFGDNAELAADTSKQILIYLVTNSADYISDRRISVIFRSVSITSTPVRITDIPYIKQEHGEIPRRLINGNDKVASFSRCEVCHKTARLGYYGESNVRIPGVGKRGD